ncbi:MAG: hypothetical protein QXV18_03040, partial [Candidatus Nitrosocaldus sp.]
MQSNYIVVYSSSYGKLANGDVDDLMDYIKNSFEIIGIKVKKIGVIDDKKNVHKILERESELNGRVIVVDISLNDKIINKDTILIRIEKNENYNNNIEFVCELKYDGLAVELIYENGILTIGSTRGNGEVGEII